MPELTVNATSDQIETVTDFVNGLLADLGCPDDVRIDIDVAIDELLGNIVRYAYKPGTGTVTVRAETDKDPPGLTVTFMDHGIPFNPLAETRPDTTSLPVRERSIGGLGLFMVRELMDEMTYSYRDGQNVLTVRKAI